MRLKEFDIVRILNDRNDGVKKGEIGSILMVFEEPREAYEVEVVDERGNPKFQSVFFPEEIELI